MMECECKEAKSPSPHPVVSKSFPISTKQTDIAVDAVFIEEVPYLHSIFRCTAWSETSTLRNRQICKQSRVFRKIQITRHGQPIRQTVT